MKIKINDDLTLTTYSENIPAQYSSNIPFELELPEKYQNSLIVPGYIFYDRNKKIESAIDNYNDGRFTLPSNTFLKDGMIGIAFSIKSGDLIETTEIAQFKVRKSVNTSFALPDQVAWQSMLQNFMDQYMDKVYSAEIRGLIDKAKELQASDEILQELINTAIKSCGQYKFENSQLFFKQADGTWGEGINLNVSVEEFENIVRRVTSLETNGVAVGDTLPIGSVVYIEGDEKDIPTGYQKLEIVPQPPKQLLINNDFQVNQRGKSEYAYPGDGTLIKTHDMHYISGSYPFALKLNEYGKPIFKNSGETISTGRQRQYLTECLKQRIVENNYKLTMAIEYIVNVEQNVSIKIGNEEKEFLLTTGKNNVSHTFTLQSSDLLNSTIDFIYFINRSPNKNIECIVNYVDIFEGTIAYQHQKEDYAITELKCSKKLKYIRPNNNAISINLGTTYFNNYTTSESRCRVYSSINTNLDSIPMVTFSDLYIYFHSGKNYKIDTCNFYNIANGIVNLTMEFNINDGFNPVDKPCAIYLRGYLSMSCEP